MTFHEIRILYNQGNWEEANKKLHEIMRHIEELPEYFEAVVLSGWINWKRGDKVWAHNLWSSVYDSEFISEKDRVSAMCGLALYHSEMKTEAALARTLELVDLIGACVREADAGVFTAVQLNSLGIALAKIGKLTEAGDIFLEAMIMNESIEVACDKAAAKDARLGRAKNGYNLSVLVLIPKKRYGLALDELTEEVVPRYEAVEAETDLAAAKHRISEILLLQDSEDESNLQKAYDLEFESGQLWLKHLADDPKRYPQSQENLKKIQALIDAKKK